jgi:hypothetical protein
MHLLNNALWDGYFVGAVVLFRFLPTLLPMDGKVSTSFPSHTITHGWQSEHLWTTTSSPQTLDQQAEGPAIIQKFFLEFHEPNNIVVCCHLQCVHFISPLFLVQVFKYNGTCWTSGALENWCSFAVPTGYHVLLTPIA